MSNLIKISALILLSVFCVSCKKDKDNIKDPKLNGMIIIDAGITDTLLTFESINGAEITMPVHIPDNGSNLSAVIVLHGSGGNWDDDDTDGDGIDDVINKWVLSSQNRNWQELLATKNYVSAFPGSYYPRGTVENTGDWKNPPLQFKISASFIRNYDAYNALKLLRKLIRPSGAPVIATNKIALIGFSHGGTTIQSTIFDQSAIPQDWEWTQSYDEIEYTDEILPPAEVPEEGGFVAAVMYYPGSFHNSYYGNPCNGTSIFRSYCDFVIHLASEDPLTENSICMIETVQQNGGGKVVSFTYEQANHGFDNKSDGVDGDASILAKNRSLEFLRPYLE